jgi:hypothetical protein
MQMRPKPIPLLGNLAQSIQASSNEVIAHMIKHEPEKFNDGEESFGKLPRREEERKKFYNQL